MAKCINFEWDDHKDVSNVEKHGIDFKEASKVFFDQNRIIAKDDKHSTREQRYFCIGKVDEHIVTVRFTYRGNKIRLIGAGYWRKGKACYEEKN